MAKKRLNMFDAMDGALARLGGLTEAAEKAKTLPFKLKQEDEIKQPGQAAQPSSPIEQPNQAAHLSSLGKQLTQAAQLSCLPQHGAEVSSPPKQPNSAAEVSSLPKQLNQAAHLSSPNRQANALPVRLEPKSAFFTPAQKSVLRYFQINGSHVTTYDIIANDSKVPRGTVRQIVDKMVALGLLDRSQWRQGRNCGLQFTLHGQNQATQHANPTPQASTTPQHPNQACQNHGIGKIDREKNLSISLETIRLTWPNLARLGFGSDQVDQIAANLGAVGKSTERVVQGLDHAEWELANGKMTDKDGQPVADPCAWVFQALARTGYYRRPAGYVSPEEQADLDAAAEAKARARSRETARQERFQAWAKGLSAEERKIALEGCYGPEEAWLKNVWIKRGEPDA